MIEYRGTLSISVALSVEQH